VLIMFIFIGFLALVLGSEVIMPLCLLLAIGRVGCMLSRVA